MNYFNVDVIDSEYADVPKKTGKGTYGVITVTYKNEEGKVEAKKVFDFGIEPEPFQKLKLAKKGDTFSIGREKNDKGYWDWKEVSTQVAAVGKPQVPVKSNYETAEERAQRQVFIMKQSSLSSAVEFLKTRDVSEEDVLKLAEKFFNYVSMNRVQDMADDEIE